MTGGTRSSRWDARRGLDLRWKQQPEVLHGNPGLSSDRCFPDDVGDKVVCVGICWIVPRSWGEEMEGCSLLVTF